MRLILAIRPFGSVHEAVTCMTFVGTSTRRLLHEAMKRVPPSHDVAWVRIERDQD